MTETPRQPNVCTVCGRPLATTGCFRSLTASGDVRGHWVGRRWWPSTERIYP